MGQQVAAKGVTVVDDGTMHERRGSLTIDDEGTPTNRTVLIEDGILVGYMQDRQNARLMGMKPTGNGRRESYGHVRCRHDQHLHAGRPARPKEIIASVKNGIYAVSFGGGRSTSCRANTCSSAPRPTNWETARSARRSRARC